MAFNVSKIGDIVTEDGIRIISVSTCREVCSSRIDLAVKDGIVLKVQFLGGCQGNTTGIASLISGMPVEEAVRRLEGIDCHGKGTSCPDQLAKALKLTME